MSAPRHLSFHHNDLTLAGLDWGGTGPDLVLLHPNGFCAGVYDPIAQRLTANYRVVGLDLPGHGLTEVPAQQRRLGFDHAADDVVAFLDVLGIDRALVAGVSMGAAVGIMFAARHPQRVVAHLACEAIAFPPSAIGERPEPNPMAAGALKRRHVWPDRESVVASYSARPPLGSMAPAAMEAYVRYGFVDREDGDVELACPGEVEAAYFAMEQIEVGAFTAFDELVNVQCPIQLVAGAGTNLDMGYFEAQAESIGQDLLVVPGSHFFLFEDIDAAVALIDGYLSQQV